MMATKVLRSNTCYKLESGLYLHISEVNSEKIFLDNSPDTCLGYFWKSKTEPKRHGVKLSRFSKKAVLNLIKTDNLKREFAK